jgi:multiple sugar transport system substrate-binding protein
MAAATIARDIQGMLGDRLPVPSDCSREEMTEIEEQSTTLASRRRLTSDCKSSEAPMAGSRSPRLWYALAIVVVAVYGVTAGDISTAAQAPTAIRFAFWGDPAEQAAYEQVVSGFEATHPGIDVTLDYTPGQTDYYRKIATDFAGNDPPDVFLINYRQFGQYAARGALEPVASYLDASPTIRASDYAPIAMDAFKYGGDQVCMPQNVSSLVVYYNVDLFTANGVPLPAPGWTWNKFMAAAEALTQDTDGDGQLDQYGVVVEPIMYRMVPFVWSAGGEIVDDLDHPTRLALDSPQAIKGIETFLSLGVSGHNVVPSEEEVAAEEDADRFMRGGAAMFLQSRREVPTLRQIEGFTWDVAPLPIIDEVATVLHSDAFCMASATTDKEAVWDFIEYAVGETGQLILAETGRIVPSRTNIAQSPIFLNGVPVDARTALSGAGSPAPEVALPPASSEVFLANIPAIHRLPSLSTWPEVEDIFNAEFDRAFSVPLDVPAAIARVIERSGEPLARAAAEDAAP